MTNHHRRLKTIELTLTPEQIVLLWLGRARAAGGFCDIWRSSPEPRSFIAIAVSKAISERMQPFPEPLVGRAILKGRQKADVLYMLIVHINGTVLESEHPTGRAFSLLARYMLAVAQAPRNADQLKELRSALVPVIEDMLILEDAITRATAEHFINREILFRDASKVLEKQLEMVKRFVESFNYLTFQTPIAKIDLEVLRITTQSKVLAQCTEWIRHARLNMLLTFDPGESWRIVLDEFISGKPSVKESDECVG